MRFVDDEQRIAQWLQSFLANVEILWPHHQPETASQSLLALALPGDENSALWRIAVHNEHLHSLVGEAISAPILAIRFFHLTAID